MTTQREITNARKRLAREGYARCAEDVNCLDYAKIERADILLPGGFREAWVRPRKQQSS